MHEEVEQRGTDQASENDRRDGVKNLLPRFARCQHQRHQGDPGGESRHHHRCDAFPARPLNHLASKALALMLHQMQIVGDEENAIARRNATQRDEANHAGNSQRLMREDDGRHRANRCHRQGRQHLKCKVGRPEQGC